MVLSAFIPTAGTIITCMAPSIKRIAAAIHINCMCVTNMAGQKKAGCTSSNQGHASSSEQAARGLTILERDRFDATVLSILETLQGKYAPSWLHFSCSLASDTSGGIATAPHGGQLQPREVRRRGAPGLRSARAKGQAACCHRGAQVYGRPQSGAAHGWSAR